MDAAFLHLLSNLSILSINVLSTPVQAAYDVIQCVVSAPSSCCIMLFPKGMQANFDKYAELLQQQMMEQRRRWEEEMKRREEVRLQAHTLYPLGR